MQQSNELTLTDSRRYDAAILRWQAARTPEAWAAMWSEHTAYYTYLADGTLPPEEDAHTEVSV